MGSSGPPSTSSRAMGLVMSSSPSAAPFPSFWIDFCLWLLQKALCAGHISNLQASLQNLALKHRQLLAFGAPQLPQMPLNETTFEEASMQTCNHFSSSGSSGFLITTNDNESLWLLSSVVNTVYLSC